jgi:hypothetical protein
MQRECAIVFVASQFSTLSHKRHDFRKKKKLLNIKCVFWFSIQVLFETFLFLKRIQRDIVIKWKNRFGRGRGPVVWQITDEWIVINVKTSSYALFFSDFNETWIFCTDCKKTRISHLIKIRPERAKLFLTDGRTDRQTDRQTDRRTWQS